jgi:two-component system, sensor histidine kinase and response regulator
MSLYDFYRQWSILQRSLLAVIIFLVAFGLRYFILPINGSFYFLTFYPATIICSYLCGRYLGMLMAIVSSTAAYYFFMPSAFRNSPEPGPFFAIAVFLLAAYLIGLIVQKLQNHAEQLRITLAELKESEQRYLSILEDQTEILCRFKQDGTILYVNEAYCRLFNRPKNTILGEKWQPAVWSEDLSLVNEKLATLSPENPVVTIENRIVTPGRGIRWAQFINRAIYDEAGKLKELQSVGRDITEQKELEQKLAATTADLLDLYNNAPCGYNSLAPNGTYLRINDTELSWLGRRRHDLIGKMKPSDFLTPNSQAIFNNAFSQLVKGTNINNLELELITNRGSIKHISVSATPVNDNLGNFVMSRSIFFDISEQKNAIKHLHEIEQKFSKVFQASPIGMAISQVADSVFIDVNQAFLNIYGLTREQIIGHTFHEFGLGLNPDYREKMISTLMRQGSISNVEVDHSNRSGEISTLLVSMHNLEIAGNSCLLTLLLDITERKRAELKLRKLASAVEQSAESVMITNLDAEIEYVNSAFQRNSGYNLAEVIKQNPRILQSGKTPKETYDELWDSLTKGQCWKGEFINKRKDGSEYIELAKISPILDASGNVTHYVDVKEDVTEKKRITQELDEHRQHLESLVAARTKELQQALALAESANKAKSSFLANMSHEIRTPMNAIIGLTYLLKQHDPSSEQSRRLEMIESAAQNLLSIINAILDLSKIEAGRLELEETDFAIEAVLDHISSLISAEAKSKGLVVIIDHNQEPIWVRGDLARLNQALLNYANNAVKFTDQGTITLRSKILDENPAGLLVRFEVQDTGIGIPEDKLSSLFEAFTQVDISTTREYGGTGLGLAISRCLANLMGGKAGVESNLGQGSVFWFTAMLQRGQGYFADKPSVNASEAKYLLSQNHSNARLLLAEDNPINREVMLDLLHGLFLSVDIAENGLEAVEKIRQSHYDLILMDLQMPEMDGFEASRVIRCQAGFEQTPILAMTASALEEDRNACLAAGMNDFINKPADPETLYRTLLLWLSSRHQAHNGLNLNEQPVESAIEETTDLSSTHDSTTAEQLLPTLDTAHGIALVNGKVSKYRSLLQKFTKSHCDDIKMLNAFLQDGDKQQAQHISHALKGVAGTLCADHLAHLAAQLDMALLLDSPVSECLKLADLCEAELSKLLQTISTMPDEDVIDPS